MGLEVADANVQRTVIDNSFHDATSVGSGVHIPIDPAAAVTNADLLIRGHRSLVDSQQPCERLPECDIGAVEIPSTGEVVCVKDLSGTRGPGDGGVRGAGRVLTLCNLLLAAPSRTTIPYSQFLNSRK